MPVLYFPTLTNEFVWILANYWLLDCGFIKKKSQPWKLASWGEEIYIYILMSLFYLFQSLFLLHLSWCGITKQYSSLHSLLCIPTCQLFNPIYQKIPSWSFRLSDCLKWPICYYHIHFGRSVLHNFRTGCVWVMFIGRSLHKVSRLPPNYHIISRGASNVLIFKW